jgi:eukaryotic-like serine/threonine-protein kinase
MGTVYEAEHVALGRVVAIKVLHRVHASGKEPVIRFYREARAAGCIGHPNVCEVYDVDKLDDGRPYLVMEKLVGETLSRRIAVEGKLPPGEMVHILIQVLSALAAAHERRIIHRDIKPENVLLAERSGCPPLAKLLDFGVSKTTRRDATQGIDDVDLTRRGTVMGTPHYLSPEQARGDRDLDARVDIYACGVLLYEGLTGQRPFHGPTHAELLRAILSAKPRPARELRRALPSGFDAVLAKAMARDRNARYTTAADFQRDLQLLREQPEEGPRLGAKILRPRPVPPALGAESDDHPTQVWGGRLPQPAAPKTTLALERSAGFNSDDRDTVVRSRLSERLARAERERF